MANGADWLELRLLEEQLLIADFVRQRHQAILTEFASAQPSLRTVASPRLEGDQESDILIHKTGAHHGASNNFSYESLSDDSCIPAERQEITLYTKANTEHLDDTPDAVAESKPALFQHTRCPIMWAFLPKKIETVVFSPAFEIISASAILVNTLVMAFELQLRGGDLGLKQGIGSGSSYLKMSAQMEGVLNALEIFFTVFFILELFLRVGALKKAVFRSVWMWLDAVLAGITVLGMLGLVDFNPSMGRLIRLARLGRVLKFLRVIRAFDSMFLLVRSIQASWNSFIWSFLLLLTVQLAVGMILCQVLYAFVSNPENELSKRKEVFKYFGTFEKTMFTMFELTYGNGFPIARVLVQTVHQRFDIVFIFYRCMFCFAVIRVISAVFISETSRLVACDDEIAQVRKEQEKHVTTRKLRNLFTALDQSGDGRLSWEEFRVLLEDTSMAHFAETMGFSRAELPELFGFFDTGDGHISMDEFTDGVARLKAHAKFSDVMNLLANIRRLAVKTDSIGNALTKKIHCREKSNFTSPLLAIKAPENHAKLGRAPFKKL